MPTLADLDDPPRRRVPQLVVGMLIAAVIAGVVVVWLFPWLRGAVLGAARDFDERARAQETYMNALCGGTTDLERDGDLCSCVLAMEHPALDCQPPWRRWALALQAERCRDEALAAEHQEYCACVAEVATAVGEALDVDKNAAAHAYVRCEAISGALALPTADSLVTP
jgi:hypothetical protein